MRATTPGAVNPAAIVDLLAERPDLRESFALADQVDLWVRS